MSGKTLKLHGRQAVLALVLAALASGCGQRLLYPARGQIVDRAGNPIQGLKGGSVELESLDHKASANGPIDENGGFRLSTQTPGDGAYLGKHRVQIMPPASSSDTPPPRVLDPKYERQETTDLFVTIEPRDNVLRLEVDLIRP